MDMDKKALLARHAPIYHFHPDEAFFPSTPEQYLSASDLFELATHRPVVKGPLSGRLLQLLSSRRAKGSAYYMRLRNTQVDCVRIGHKTDLQNVPIYGRVLRQDHTTAVLLYIAFFAHRGASTILGFAKESDAHDADFQYLIVHVSSANTVTRVFFGRDGTNGSGVWRSAADCQLEHQLQPHVYVGLNSHGLQPEAAVVVRYRWLGTERTADKGLQWTPSVQMLSSTSWAELGPDSGILWDKVAQVQLNAHYDVRGEGVVTEISLSPFGFGLLSFAVEVGTALFLSNRTSFITDQFGSTVGTILSILISYALLWMSQAAIRLFARDKHDEET